MCFTGRWEVCRDITIVFFQTFLTDERSLNKNAEQEFIPTSKLLYTAKVAISGVCANGNQTHVVLNCFLICGELLSRIMLCGMASCRYNFIKFCMVKHRKQGGGGLTVILSSFSTGCQVKDFLGRQGNYFLWFQKKTEKCFGGKISNSTLFGFRPDWSLCSFVNFIKHVFQKSG